MADEPSGAALLDAARASLLREIEPALSGRPRYVAAMVANAIGIVAREIEAGAGARAAWERAARAGSEATPAGLAAAIRAGALDGDVQLHAALTEASAAAAAIWKPKPAPGA
ncbi:DUF6285 domain-containing protein [Methylobacterium nigriterrae]|uniref:DUF6285 domain-containing protein n=1 Tax=Methylobacterium nigriterrae TaxID=3127512 RepID=UPI0030137FCB